MVKNKRKVRQEMWDVHVTDPVCALGMTVKDVEMENEERVFSAMEFEVMNTISAKIITEVRGCRFYCFSNYLNS